MGAGADASGSGSIEGGALGPVGICRGLRLRDGVQQAITAQPLELPGGGLVLVS